MNVNLYFIGTMYKYRRIIELQLRFLQATNEFHELHQTFTCRERRLCVLPSL